MSQVVLVMEIKPLMIRSSVDLQQPEGPMIEKNTPDCTSRDYALICSTEICVRHVPKYPDLPVSQI